MKEDLIEISLTYELSKFIQADLSNRWSAFVPAGVCIMNFNCKQQS